MPKISVVATGTIELDAVELVAAPALSSYDAFRADFAHYISGADHDQQASWRLPIVDRRLSQSLH